MPPLYEISLPGTRIRAILGLSLDKTIFSDYHQECLAIQLPRNHPTPPHNVPNLLLLCVPFVFKKVRTNHCSRRHRCPYSHFRLRWELSRIAFRVRCTLVTAFLVVHIPVKVERTPIGKQDVVYY